MSLIERVEPERFIDPEPPNRHLAGPSLVGTFLHFVRASVVLALLLPFVIAACSWLLGGQGAQIAFWFPMTILAIVAVLPAARLSEGVYRLQPLLETLGKAQVRFLDRLPARRVPLAIAVSAGTSLFLELAVIRWHGTEWEMFAFYKNFTLLACFLGLGLGYTLAGLPRIPVVAALPLLALKVAYLLALRHGIPGDWLLSLRATPIREQLNMGVDPARAGPQFVAIYSFLVLVMLLTTLVFMPVGQLCGRLLDRLPRLKAYGWNLVGSLGGIALMLVVSFLWTPPAVWFAIASFALLSLQSFCRPSLWIGFASSAVLLAMLSWPVAPGWERVYSPYQLLERGPGERGLSLIRVAGNYFQHVHDLSLGAQAAFPRSRGVARYYDLPYRLRPQARRAMVVGAGTGNDVAAALRNGVGQVDAVEIDPVILRLGRLYHPEHPYADRRVTAVVDDARKFLRSTGNTYDLIVFGLLDSHTLLSHTSSIRLDSYVYTVEALREARSRLEPGGVLSLSFAVLSDELGRKIYLMMQEAFDGHPPASIDAGYGTAMVFAQSKEGDLRVSPVLLEESGFHDLGGWYGSPALRADVSTDDWPFFYMPQRVYPTSYLWAVGLVLSLSLVLYSGFVGARPRRRTLPFFFLGAGFMLVETKGIAELGLAFGNTWLVIGIVIGAILVMAWLGNWVAGWMALARPWVPWLMLLASLGLGLAFVRAGGIGSMPAWTAVVLLTCPLFFSGIVFSTVLSSSREASSALGLNLLGAMAGGVLEYNSMYFGLQSLYLLAFGLYSLGLVLFMAGDARAPR